MAQMKGPNQFQHYIHGEGCKCFWDKEVYRRKHPLTPAETQAVQSAAAAELEARRKAFREAEAFEQAQVRQSGFLDAFVQSIYQPKPVPAEDIETKRLRDKEQAEKEFSKRGGIR